MELNKEEPGIIIYREDEQLDHASLKNINPRDIDTFLPDIDKATCIKCYDADTITIACYPKNAKGGPYKYAIRILGIDTPEIRPKKPINEDDMLLYENEKKVAKIARDKLALMIFKNTVRLENISNDKYGGRILADVYYDDIKVSDWLLQKNLAVPYFGKTKKPPKCWMKYYTTGER